MNSLFDTIRTLTTIIPTNVDRQSLIQQFARELGWTPSYEMLPGNEQEAVNTHLVVEHGLENSAVLSFLNKPYNQLSDFQRKRLLNVSYNNLVDWHIHIDHEKATFVFNRGKVTENVVSQQTFRNDNYESLRSEAFEKMIGKRPSPNVPPLDDALINTISYWKRTISAELDNQIQNDNFSALFNGIIFVRALEDNIKRFDSSRPNEMVLLSALDQIGTSNSIVDCFRKAQEILGKSELPTYLINYEELSSIDNLGKSTLFYLFKDFYQNRVADFYNYDFSIMSKHALSRIYEKYSALLKVEESDQLSLFSRLPNEQINKAFGAVYTPEYIARFFGRYLQQNLSPSVFSRIKVAEPSVGSGIFLRTILEIKCDPRFEENTTEKVKESFRNILGIDVDENACKASKLSLALLQLVLTGDFPEDLNIIQAETIEFLSQNHNLFGSFDAVISNPPFIATELLSDELKLRMATFLAEQSKGRLDSYLAFLKGSIELLKPGGFGLFVLPHSFLMSDSASKMRRFVFENCWVTCLVDLAAIPVFGNTGIYVILLIVQKKLLNQPINVECTLTRCREMPGRALQDCIRGNEVDNNFYSVFKVDQSFFSNDTWSILPRKELLLKEKISSFPKLKEFLDVRQGFVTGADDVFILEKEYVPLGEQDVFIPYLPDRSIERFGLPKSVYSYLFYPFVGEEKIEENQLRIDYPETWKYLLSNKPYLKSKKSFAKVKDWWRPLRTRQPEHLLVPKIVTPHLTITPKFAIDLNGKFGISRSPFLIPKERGSGEKELLLFFLGVLNSTLCYWYISNHSHKYSKGYTMIEVKTLEQTPVPDPSTIRLSDFNKIVDLVKERLSCNTVDGIEIEKKIDQIVCEIYNISSEDKKILGID